MKKIIKKRQLFNKRLVLNIILVLFMFLSIGYSTLSTNLNILGNLEVKKYYEHTLYNVLEKEAETGGLAHKYVADHHDSFTEEPSKEIYYWYAKNDNEGTQILNKSNVIFAGHCWQIYRTTDTGGVRVIYNGEAEDNQCLNTRGNHVGYASRSTTSLASSYWYGTDYTYDINNKKFKLNGTTEQAIWNSTTSSNLVGKYTCKLTSVDDTCETIYYVDSFNNNSSAYVVSLNSNSHYSEFGSLQFNANYNSLSYVGYMYNTVYPANSKTMTSTETILSTSTLNINYWYSSDIVWGDPSINKYNLKNEFQVNDESEFSNLIGKYTFRNTSQTYAYQVVYYIAGVDNTTMYYIQLANEGGSTHDLSYYNNSYTYGDSFTDNGDGTFTINNPTTINRSDWYTNYNNIGTGKYVCKNAINNTCSELRYTTEVTNTKMTFILVNNNYKYASGFTYDNNTGTYNLNNDSVTFWNINDSENKSSLNNYHYTCFNESGECLSLSYIYYVSGIMPRYIILTDGKGVDDAVNEMLYNDDVNLINSTIKSGVDRWYKRFLLDYDSYIEDTIFCYDRSQSNKLDNGWNLNGGSITTNMLFYGATGLSCPNVTDRFCVSNDKAKLTYKVGLMPYRDMNLLSFKALRNTGRYYWLGSPNYYNVTSASAWRVVNTSIGGFGVIGVGDSRGVRPSISLRPGLMYESGDGSMANPYIVKYE